MLRVLQRRALLQPCRPILRRCYTNLPPMDFQFHRAPNCVWTKHIAIPPSFRVFEDPPAASSFPIPDPSTNIDVEARKATMSQKHWLGNIKRDFVLDKSRPPRVLKITGPKGTVTIAIPAYIDIALNEDPRGSRLYLYTLKPYGQKPKGKGSAKLSEKHLKKAVRYNRAEIMKHFAIWKHGPLYSLPDPKAMWFRSAIKAPSSVGLSLLQSIGKDSGFEPGLVAVRFRTREQTKVSVPLGVESSKRRMDECDVVGFRAEGRDEIYKACKPLLDEGLCEMCNEEEVRWFFELDEGEEIALGAHIEPTSENPMQTSPNPASGASFDEGLAGNGRQQNEDTYGIDINVIRRPLPDGSPRPQVGIWERSVDISGAKSGTHPPPNPDEQRRQELEERYRKAQAALTQYRSSTSSQMGSVRTFSTSVGRLSRKWMAMKEQWMREEDREMEEMEEMERKEKKREESKVTNMRVTRKHGEGFIEPTYTIQRVNTNTPSKVTAKEDKQRAPEADTKYQHHLELQQKDKNRKTSRVQALHERETRAQDALWGQSEPVTEPEPYPTRPRPPPLPEQQEFPQLRRSSSYEYRDYRDGVPAENIYLEIDDFGERDWFEEKFEDDPKGGVWEEVRPIVRKKKVVVVETAVAEEKQEEDRGPTISKHLTGTLEEDLERREMWNGEAGFTVFRHWGNADRSATLHAPRAYDK